MAQLLRSSDDLTAMVEMAGEDDGFVEELRSELDRLETQVRELELQSLLSGPHDGGDAIVSVNARDGGVDAADWAAMLLRMYGMWAK
jgi:peptide chain release factor 2